MRDSKCLLFLDVTEAIRAARSTKNSIRKLKKLRGEWLIETACSVTTNAQRDVKDNTLSTLSEDGKSRPHGIQYDAEGTVRQ